MKLVIETHGTVSALITDDKSDLRLTMEYDDQLERYAIDMQDGEGTVTPQTPVNRIEGEGDEVYFDRACIEAQRHYLTAVEMRVMQQSRFEQLDHMKRLVETEITAIEQTFAHWDNDNPTPDDLRRMNQAVQLIRQCRDAVTDVG